jgi:pimeloyl-ACP methyl ester carboxylesterase
MPFIPWDSQPLEVWASRYAQGTSVELNGRRTHYLVKGDGPPVILLHGFFYDSYLWAGNIDALARHFTVYALDLWGSGYSTREPLDHGYPLYAEQLRLFMDRLGITRASLVGQSMGGGTAVRFAVHHRERVEKLVLVACAGLPNPMPLGMKLFKHVPRLGAFLLSLSTDTPRRRALSDSFIHDPKLITDSYFENVTRAHKIRGTHATTLTIARNDFFDKSGDDIHRLAAMDIPVLIVWGRQDKAIPVRVAHQMHAILKGSRLEILDHAGHVPNFERADEFNRLAVEFLA